MKPHLDMDKIAQGLRAERKGKVSAGGGYFGAMQLLSEEHSYDYAIIRVVPRVERGELVNVGVILSCPAVDFLDARVELDEERLRALDETLDIDDIRAHLAAIPAICAGGSGAGPIGELPQRNRFHWLVAPRSTVIQPSPVHTGRTGNPASALERLLESMVRRPAMPRRSGR